MSDMKEQNKIAEAFQAGIDSFKESDAKLEAENASLRKDWKEMKRLLELEQEKLLEQKEDIRFLLKCIVTDPTEGMGMERNDPARVHFRARLDGIREKVK